jgi:hypothetical protein
MRPHVARALADVLSAQHHVIACWQLTAARCDREVASREVAAGRWQRPAPGIYYAFAGEPTLLQRGWCAQLVGGPECVVSGALSCQLLGIADSPGTDAVVLVPADCQREGWPDFVTRRTRRLPEPLDREGLRLSPPVRAVIDASRQAPTLRETRAVVCAAINGKHTSYDELVTERRAEYSRGLRFLRHALDDWAAGARSAPEAEIADALRVEVGRGRMPPFLLNPEVYAGPVLLGSLDVYVPGCSLGAESDSVRHHGSSDALDATLVRHKTMASNGIELEHVTPTRFRRSPAAWAAMFAGLADQRRGLGDPPGLRIVPVGPLQDGRRRPTR